MKMGWEWRWVLHWLEPTRSHSHPATTVYTFPHPQASAIEPYYNLAAQFLRETRTGHPSMSMDPVTKATHLETSRSEKRSPCTLRRRSPSPRPEHSLFSTPGSAELPGHPGTAHTRTSGSDSGSRMTHRVALW